MKKSFILYNDSLLVVDELTIEQKALLFQAIVDYNLGREVKLEGLMKAIFIPFKNQFERDTQAYDAEVKRSSEKGKLGNLKRWHQDLYDKVIENHLTLDEAILISKQRETSPPDETTSPPDENNQDTIPKSLDNVTVTVKDTVTVKEKDIDIEDNTPILLKTYLANANRDLLYVSKFIREHKPDFLEPYVECWNMFADKFGKQKIIKLTKSRAKKLKLRLKDQTFVFPDILNKAKDQKFITENNWFTFDWVLENETNYLKVLEGNYKTTPKSNEQPIEVDINGKPRPSKQHRLWGGKWIVE